MRKPTPPSSGQAWFCIIAALISPILTLYREVGEMLSSSAAANQRAVSQDADIREIRQHLWLCPHADVHPAPRNP